ncbi:MAG: NAD-dependent epimerase/dehydratase family protein [Pseudomonadota bacterium]
MSPILIVGAGYSGARLAHHLHTAGVEILTTRTRSPDNPPAWPVVVSTLDAPTDTVALSTALTGHERWRVIVLVPPSPAVDRASQLEPRLQALLDCLGARAERIVYVSTTGVYGDQGGGRVDENTPVNPESRRAKARVAAERTLLQWTQPREMTSVILRVAGIYGPDRLPLRALADQQPVVRDADSGPGNRIQVDDLVACYQAALTDSAPPPIVNVCDGDLRTTAAFNRDVARLAQLPAPKEITLDDALKTFSPMRLSFINERRAIDNQLLDDWLGERLRYRDPIAGIRASLAAR